MCLVVYLAADQPLPLIPWDSERPAFYVEEVDTHGVEVRPQFSKPFVYHAGSHEGCGCGFQYGPDFGPNAWDEKQSAERKQVKQSRADLAAFLERTLLNVHEVELYACWSGDEVEPRVYRRVIRPEEINLSPDLFRERELLVVTIRSDE